ncbi:MAG: hypothetical protein ACXWJZ_11675 [Burkholderiaceae bacterium]
MSKDTWDIIEGALVIAVLLPICYVIGRLRSAIEARWHGHILAPLAPLINGKIDGGAIHSQYQGHVLRVTYAPRTSVGPGNLRMYINGFYIEASDIPGEQDWRILFFVTGPLGQGPRKLFIKADKDLTARLESSGVLQDIAAVSSAVQDYVTVAYSARLKTLTYTDDVSPNSVSTPHHFEKQLALMARLIQVNAQVNAAS